MRNPYDGQPYYCKTCGVGLAEYRACEDGNCELESQHDAIVRQQIKAEQDARCNNCGFKRTMKLVDRMVCDVCGG